MTCTHCENQKHSHQIENKNMKRKSAHSNNTGLSEVTVESLDDMVTYWHDLENDLNWDCLFVLPPWLKAWWKSFGHDYTQYVCILRNNSKIIGIAPLMLKADTAYLIGDGDICDYGDFIMSPGMERTFITALFDHLCKKNISRLDLGRLRDKTPTVSELKSISETAEYEFEIKPSDRIYHMDLPETWEAYLDSLSQKMRHEVRRKMRRLSEAGKLRYRSIEGKKELDSGINTFIKLFKLNMPQKARFMNTEMESFFRTLSHEMADAGLLKLFMLSIDDTPAAATLCFDYLDRVYLYNNGYSRHYRHLSVGLLSKIFSIQDSIKHQRKEFDFLKGDESYKRYLGGCHSQLYKCSVILKNSDD